MEDKQHVTFMMKIPQDMKKRFDLANMITQYLEGAKISPYERTINEIYSKALEQIAWAEFQYNGLKEPYGKFASTSHTVDADLKTGMLTFKRHGTKEPSIYERLNLATNLK